MKKNDKSYFKSVGLILVILLLPSYAFAQKVTKLLEKGQYEKAEQYCAKLKGEDQKSCYKVLADTYFEKKEYEKAAQFYYKTDNRNSDFIKIATVYLEENNFKMAIQYFEKAGKGKEGYEKVADAYFNQEDFDQAIKYYRNAGKQEEGYERIAEAYFNKKDFDKALTHYINAGKKSEGYEKVADAYVEMQEFMEAIKCYEKAGISLEDSEKMAKAYHLVSEWNQKIFDFDILHSKSTREALLFVQGGSIADGKMQWNFEEITPLDDYSFKVLTIEIINRSEDTLEFQNKYLTARDSDESILPYSILKDWDGTDAYSGAKSTFEIIPDKPKELSLLFILKDKEAGKINLEYFGSLILTGEK